MSKRLEIGRRYNNTFGINISAPGEPVDNVNSRLIFSSDLDFLQILYRGTIVCNRDYRDFGTYYAIECYGEFYFPETLEFRPRCFFAFYTDTLWYNGTSYGTSVHYEYRTEGPLNGNTRGILFRYVSYTGHVEVYARLYFNSSTQPSLLNVAVNVSNQSVPIWY